MKSRSPAQRSGYEDEETNTGRKAKFGDTYLSRLGVGGKSSYQPSGTDFSSTRTTEDWEEVRLKRQLQDLETRIDTIESRAKGKSGWKREESKPALVKRELEMLLDYKRKEMRELERGEGKSKAGEALKGVENEIKGVKEMVEGLEAHWKTREGVLDDLRRQIEDEQRAGR